jgi:hypothetical protein
VPSARLINCPIVCSCALALTIIYKGAASDAARLPGAFKVLKEAVYTCKSINTALLLAGPGFAKRGYGAEGRSAPGISEKRLLL